MKQNFSPMFIGEFSIKYMFFSRLFVVFNVRAEVVIFELQVSICFKSLIKTSACCSVKLDRLSRGVALLSEGRTFVLFVSFDDSNKNDRLKRETRSAAHSWMHVFTL